MQDAGVVYNNNNKLVQNVYLRIMENGKENDATSSFSIFLE